MLKLAISNIAWHSKEEGTVAALMQERGVQGVEIAPTAVWNSPLETTDAEIGTYREFWERHGIQVVAMQALLFGRPDLTIFESDQKRRNTIDYLAGMIRLGGKLGAKALVFGSPKNRRIGNLSQTEVERIAIPFFRELGEVAADNHTTLCIEPNPTHYDCDFVTTSQEGADLVRSVGSKGFGLHLDAGGMSLSSEPPDLAIEQSFHWLRHFHVSEPFLAQIGTAGVDHATCAKALARLGYQGWVSIEMKAQSADSCLGSVEDALAQAGRFYCSADIQSF